MPVIGTICADGHARIAFSQEECPLCACAELLLKADDEVNRMADDLNTRESELQSLRDRLAELSQ